MKFGGIVVLIYTSLFSVLAQNNAKRTGEYIAALNELTPLITQEFKNLEKSLLIKVKNQVGQEITKVVDSLQDNYATVTASIKQINEQQDSILSQSFFLTQYLFY